MANSFVRTAGQLLFTWSLAGVALDELTSGDKLKLGDKGSRVYRMLTPHVARDNSALSVARREDATCFLKLIMSVIQDASIQACHQTATGNKALEKKVSSVILNVYQSTGIEKDDDSRQSPENEAKIDENRRFSKKKFDDSHDVHRALALGEDFSKPTKRGEYQHHGNIIECLFEHRGRNCLQKF